MFGNNENILSFHDTMETGNTCSVSLARELQFHLRHVQSDGTFFVDNHSLVLGESIIALNLRRSKTLAILPVVWWLQLYSRIKQRWLVLASGLCGFPKEPNSFVGQC